MGLAAGVPAHTCMVCHSRRGRCGGSRGIPTVVAAAAATVVAVVWLVGRPAPAPVWAGVPARPQVPAAVVVVAAAAMWAVTALAGIVAAVAVVVGFPAAGSALVAAATGVAIGTEAVVVGGIQGPAAVRVWCYSGGQRLTRRAYWHCFRVGRS